MTNAIVLKRDAGTLTATLNRPEKLNALNKEMFDGLAQLFEVVETDRTVRCLILTGAGEKAFCVGADLKERQGMTEKAVRQRLDWVHTLWLRLERLPVPTVAAIQGLALGGGLELALACDLRVCDESVQMGLPEVELAIIPGNGGTQRLTRLIGAPKAMELIFLGRRFDSREALSLGIVNAVVDNGRALGQARVWGAKFAEGGPLALRAAKLAIRGGQDRKWDEAMKWELECYFPLLASKDRVEGLAAFTEKRKPVYRGE